jgi:hypothetical protein
MSFYRRRVVPCLVHLAMRQKPLVPFRRRVIGAAQGTVLEIGIGSGPTQPWAVRSPAIAGPDHGFRQRRAGDKASTGSLTVHSGTRETVHL